MPRKMRATLFTVAATLLLVLGCADVTRVAATAFSTTSTSSIAVQTTPPLPLLDVVFLATTSAGTDKTLFISSSTDCSSRLTPVCTLGRLVTGVNYNSSTCIFNITSSSIGAAATSTAFIPSLYWCSSAAGSTYFATLQMNRVAVTPPYAYVNTDTTITFNAATPVGTTIGLYTTSACGTLLSGTTMTTLTSTRSLDINIAFGAFFVCARVPTVYNDVSALAVRAVVYGTNRYSLYTTTGIRHRTVTISATATFSYVALSTNPQCVPLSQTYQQIRDGNQALTINVPRGTYYFCAVVNAGFGDVGAFVPSDNRFTVDEYGVQPHTMYTGQTTTMTFSLDAVAVQSSLQAALFSTSACSTSSGTQLTDWSSTMVWSVSTTGTYYACVRTGQSSTELGYVNQVVVSSIPSVTFSRNPGIMGLGEVATVTRNDDSSVASAIVAVGISTSSTCATLIDSGNTTATGMTASFYISANSPSSVYSCVSNRLTTDMSNGESSEVTTAVFYPLGTLVLGTYSLSFPPLRTGTQLTVTLDEAVSFVSGTKIILAPALTSGSESDDDDDATCDAAIAASDETMTFEMSGSDFALTPLTFPSAGDWLLCVKEQSVLDNAAVRLRTLPVYGNATVTPSGVLPGFPASLSITDIPPSKTVSLTTAATCSSSMTAVQATTSTIDGTATLSFTYNFAGTLLLCVGYSGELHSQDTPAVLMIAGSVVSANVRVVPPVAVAGTATTLTFSAPGAPALNGYTAMLVASTNACPSTASSSNTQFPISGSSAPGTAAANEIATATFSPTTSMIGTTYLVCVGTANSFVASGKVSVVAAPVLTTSPAPLAFGLPARVTFPTSYMTASNGDVFVMIPQTDSCTADLSRITRYATGMVDAATGKADVFVAPSLSAIAATTVRLCVAQGSKLVNSTLGYADAGTTPLVQFTSVTQYLQADRTNNLVGSPAVSDGSLYLVSCSGTGCTASNADAACASTTATQYTTSSTVALTAPAGTYLLCQSVSSSSAIVGSNTTVYVVRPYVMTTTATTSALRVFVPFAVTISGGSTTSGSSDGESSMSYTVVVQPASAACDTTASESQTFTLTSGTNTITITDLTPSANIHFCVRPSTTDGFEVLTGYLMHYMTPAVVIAGAATTVTSGAPASGATAKLATSSTCASVVTGGSTQYLVNNEVTFTIDGCDPTTMQLRAVYYCETDSAGVFSSRGAMTVLRSSNCSGGGPTASISMRYVEPGVGIGDYGLATTALTNPRLSRTSACDGVVDSGVSRSGYTPGANETALFYVCADVVDAASVVFTTASPTLRVWNWAVWPTAALSRYNQTMGRQPSVPMTANYAMPTANTFFSVTSTCSASLASAPGLAISGGTATYRSVGVSGLVYVCTTDPLTQFSVAVAQFLSVTPPQVTGHAPAIVRGATYTATLVVPGASPTYSMVQDADAAYLYSGYFTSANRSVYLSTDACSTGLSGTRATTADSDGRVSLSAPTSIPPSVTSASLCAGTAAGFAVTISSITIAADSVYPTQFVSGAVNAAIYIPLYANTVFQLSQSNGDCTSTPSMPAFTTDGEGYATVSLVTSQDTTALSVGTYTLCANVNPPSLTPVDTITVVAASYFSIRGSTFVLGVPSTMELLQDLKASYLYTGFSASRECSSMTTAYGTWASLTDTSVSVSATTAYTSNLYLCAQSQQNSSIVSLPAPTASIANIQFVEPTVAIPSSGFGDACSALVLTQCYPPGSVSASSTDVLVMVYGDCCDTASRTRVVGHTVMTGSSCTMHFNYTAVESYGSDVTFNMCVWNTADTSVCTTVATGAVLSTTCTPATNTGKSLSKGSLAGIIIGCVLGGLLLILLILLLIWCCYCRHREHYTKSVKERDLVAYQEYADGDNHLVGYLMGGRHPLLYYPTGSRVGRSISPSPPYPSTSSGNYCVAEELEEEGRDQISLQEARARYNLRLLFSEQLQALEVEAKNAAVNAGLNSTWASGDSYLRGVARPIRRSVESIITDDNDTSLQHVSNHDERVFVEVPAAAAAPRHARQNEIDVAAHEFPEERDVNLTADGNASAEVDAATGRRRKVRSCSIESAPRRRVSPTESFLTNDDFEEREESGEEDDGHGDDAENADIDVAYNVLSGQEGLAEKNKKGEEDDEVPRRRIVVRHFTNPSSVKSRQRSGSGSQRRRSSSRNRGTGTTPPHFDPTQLDAETPSPPHTEAPRSTPGNGDSEQSDLQTPVRASPGQQTDQQNPPHQQPGPVFAFGIPQRAEHTPERQCEHKTDATGDSGIFSRSPIAAAGPHDISEGALTEGCIIADGSAAPVVALQDRSCNEARRVPSDDEEEDEMDLLSFTTTQRFHDEKRFLLEQEDGRRQRLWNWEEEERAELEQQEVNGYMMLPVVTPNGAEHSAAGVAATTTSTTAISAEEDPQAAAVGGINSRAQGEPEEEDEEVYHAPNVPAHLPTLPPAPRPQTLQNEQYHVVPTEPAS